MLRAMRWMRARSRHLLLLWWPLAACASLALAAAACSSAPAGCVPDPPCPAGLIPDDSCTSCVPAGRLDLAVPASEMHLPCGGGCFAPTPVCGPNDVCVACAGDSDCPSGTWCGSDGNDRPVCLPGCGNDARCATLGATFRCCVGRCVDGAADPDHCGGCGTACRFDHAAASCRAGTCAPGACQPGWGDCDGEAASGCETNLRVDVSHCGACGTTCAAPHGTPACAGTCYLAQCDFGWDDCNGDPSDGCEAGLLSDVKSCGGCGVACPVLPHAKVRCDSGSCAVASCDTGFADCDGKPANGCEVTLAADARHCGACGAACNLGLICRNGACTCANCNFANAQSACVNNVCVMGACVPGYADCNASPVDGCEADLGGDAKNCGACGKACPMNAPSCSAGMCTACSNTIANAGAGDFHIRFTLQTAAMASSSVICQRGVCSHAMMWDIRMSPAGILNLEFDDNNVNYTTMSTVSRLNDNVPHVVEANRVGGVLHLIVDGNEEAQKPCATNFGALPALAVGSGDPCEGKDGTVALNGMVTNVCLTVP